MRKLKPCPFCGYNKPKKYIETYCYKKNIAINCPFGSGGCGACGPFWLTLNAAINAWNRRSKKGKK